MKILMLTDYFYPHIGGGVEKVVYEVSKRLVRLGCDVTIVTLNTKKAKEFEFLEGLKIYRIGSMSLTRAVGAQLTISPYAPFKILKVCKRENPEIIHANNRFFFTTMCAVALKNLLEKPLITTLHLGPMALGKGLLNLAVEAYEKTISKWIMKKSDRITAVSNAVKEHAIGLGAPRERITVISNGINLDEFKPNEKGDDNPKQVKKVVFVGRLIFNKGVQYLLEAAPKVIAEHPNVKFIVVGTGPLKREVQIRAKKLGVLGSFKFLGIVPSVADILRECDVFVRPSLTEATSGGVAALEAMACGLPVVVTKVAGNETVINGKTGILIEPGNTQQLADSLIQLLNDYEFLRRLGNNARLFVEKKYNWEKTAELTLQVYKECLGEKVY